MNKTPDHFFASYFPPNHTRALFTRVLFWLFLAVIVGASGAGSAAAEEPDLTDPTSPPPDPRFGLVEAIWEPDDAAELRIGWERILFYWREIQPTGPEDWNTLHVLEEWLNEADAQERRVMGVLKNTPLWATEDDNEAGLPIGLYLPIDDPENLWANYVRRIAQYYAPLGVHDWIIWNEPDIERGVFGFEFAGDDDDYVQLLKVASIVIKEEDPQAKIHLAGVTYWHDPGYLERLMGVIAAEEDAAEHDYYFDTLTLHIYFRSETVPFIVSEAQRALDMHGLGDKDIWINETNAAPTLDPLWLVDRPQFPINLEQQAWYIPQAYALGFAAGADSIGVYKLRDFSLPPGGESFGILRPDGSRRPAYYAYQNTINQLSWFDAVAMVPAPPSQHIVRFNWADKVTHVAWARTAEPARALIPATEREALVVDAYGEVIGMIRPLDGYYWVDLAGATCLEDECLVGGAPVFVVENAPLPTATPTNTPTVTPTSLPTQPPTATSTPSPTVTASSTASLTATLPPTAEPTPSATPVAIAQVDQTAAEPLTADSADSAPTNRPGLLFMGFSGSLVMGIWIWRRWFRRL